MPEFSLGIKGFFCDGDQGLLALLRERFPKSPVQLCVFHRYARLGQLIPFRYCKNALDKQIKERVEKVLFAESKDAAVNALHDLEQFAKQNQGYEKLQKAIAVLHHNFELLLTQLRQLGFFEKYFSPWVAAYPEECRAGRF